LAPVKKDELEALSASILRTMLISEIQQFIHSLELKSSVENLVKKRDQIKDLIQVLSGKEELEFDQLMGRYFPNGRLDDIPRRGFQPGNYVI
jgi:hypothetical protein